MWGPGESMGYVSFRKNAYILGNIVYCEIEFALYFTTHVIYSSFSTNFKGFVQSFIEMLVVFKSMGYEIIL